MNRIAILLSVLLSTACSSHPEGTMDGDCADAKDNDRNNFVDCEDPGCQLDDHCIAIAAKAALAAEKAKPAPAAPVPAPMPDTPHVVVDTIWAERLTNGVDIDRIEAEAYCDRLVLSGKDDWRLPTRGEAVKISASGLVPAEPLVMWTSARAGNRGEIVGISTGAVNNLGVHSKGQCRARCVRDNN